MAPISSHATRLQDVYASSPRLFWTILGTFAFVLFVLLGFGVYKLISYSRTKGSDRASSPSYAKKPRLRSFHLPRVFPPRTPKKKTWLAKTIGRIRPTRTPAFVPTSTTSAAPPPTRLFTSRSAAPPPSYASLPPPRSMCAAWTAEHDRFWELQRDIINTGGPLCGGELLPWAPYEPSLSPVSNAANLVPPPPCVVKGAPVSAPTSSTPKASRISVLTTVEEAAADTTLASAFSADTLWSQDSVRAAPEPAGVPAIVVQACPDARPQSLGLFELCAYCVDYLRVPVPGEAPPPSRPLLGSVNRGGRVKPAAAPS